MNSTGHVKFVDEHMENYDTNSALHRKLHSKTEALKIIRKEVEQYRMERDQFKLMAETLQVRYSTMKKSLNHDYGNMDRSKVGALLNETREQNIALSTEVENLKQKLTDMQGDMKVLRSHKCSNNGRRLSMVGGSGGMATGLSELERKELEWNEEKSKIISQMEGMKKKNAQLQYDFRSLLDEKEEIVTERDAYKCKVHRLNHELNMALKNEHAQSKVLDIDALVLENKYLQDRLKTMDTELELSQHTLSKYKAMLDIKRKKGIIKLGNNSANMIMSHKQVKTLLERGTHAELPLNAATITDLKSLCLTLLDSLNDKNLAYTHQKKANKILAERIVELEQRLQSIFNDTAEGGATNNVSEISPSQLLLKGYTSSTVDQETTTHKIDEDSGTASSDGSKCPSHDRVEPVSSAESNKSIASSEYEATNIESDTSSECRDDDDDEVDTTLRDLPPELAAMVQDALRQLNESEEVAETTTAAE